MGLSISFCPGQIHFLNLTQVLHSHYTVDSIKVDQGGSRRIRADHASGEFFDLEKLKFSDTSNLSLDSTSVGTKKRQKVENIIKEEECE